MIISNIPARFLFSEVEESNTTTFVAINFFMYPTLIEMYYTRQSKTSNGFNPLIWRPESDSARPSTSDGAKGGWQASKKTRGRRSGGGWLGDWVSSNFS